MVISVQYLRAVAALMVVFSHLAKKSMQYNITGLEWFHIGGAGVDLFFIISGFIMCQASQSRELSILTFLKARVLRIIPLYWILTTVALCAFLIIPSKINSSGGVTSILHSYTLLPGDWKFLIQNGWTLSYEFYFYGLFSLGLFFSGSLRYFTPILIIIILVVLGEYFNFQNTKLDFLTKPVLLEFVFGIACFHLLRAISIPKVIRTLLFVGGGSALFLANLKGGYDIRIIEYGLPCLAIFISVVSCEEFFRQHSENWISRLFKSLGDSSYSLYLLHPFSLVFGSVAIDTIWPGQNSIFMFSLSLLLLALVSGYYCYLYLEKPLVSFTKKFL